MNRIPFVFTLFLFTTVQMHGADKWENCIGNQSCYPTHYCEPASVEELQNTTKEASSKGYHIKAIGNGYSISDLGCTDGYLISLKKLNHLLSVDIKNHCVSVEAGITLRELNEQLATHGLALPNQAAIAEITLGGALSTGIHGTGHTGTLSSFIKEIELMTADGRLHRFSEQQDPEAFAASTLSLGALGIIYKVTVQCEPLFYLKHSSAIDSLENTLENYEMFLDTNHFFQFSWDVPSGKTVLHQWNRTRDQNQIELKDVLPAYKALAWYLIDVNDKDLFSEIAVPRNRLKEALHEVKQISEKYIKLGATLSEINIRFVAKDNSYLSPTCNGPAAYIALSILEKDRYIEFYKEMEEALLKYGGCPHWGKLNFLDYEKVNGLYGNNLHKFIEIKQRLDPQSLFSNAFTRRIFCKI